MISQSVYCRIFTKILSFQGTRARISVIVWIKCSASGWISAAAAVQSKEAAAAAATRSPWLSHTLYKGASGTSQCHHYHLRVVVLRPTCENRVMMVGSILIKLSKTCHLLHRHRWNLLQKPSPISPKSIFSQWGVTREVVRRFCQTLARSRLLSARLVGQGT